jgi:RNA polymerase-binding transcription factor DksA
MSLTLKAKQIRAKQFHEESTMSSKEDLWESTGPGASGPWVQRLEAKRQQLRDLRRELTTDLPTGESQRDLDGELSSLDQHPADAASMTYELEVEQALLHQIDDELNEIEEAFGRLESGEFGRCEMCAGPIGDERLRARPGARFCVAHEKLARGPGP